MESFSFLQNALPILTRVGLQVVGAFVMWTVGRVLIRLALRLVDRSMTHEKIDATLVRYVTSVLSVALQVALVVAILGFFGIETTTFAALIAAAGVAIGLAWSGLLANFAAGAFLVILRPFRVGDFVSAGGITGTVREVGLFVTTIVTPDNVVTYVGNNKVFSDNVQNFSANPYRRVDLVAQLSGATDHRAAIELLKKDLARIPNVVATPPPEVAILEFNLVGPVLAVRPYTHTDNYWQVYFDANRMIRESFGQAGFPAPVPSLRSVA
jgi:small conductance mechanosensitive channel